MRWQNQERAEELHALGFSSKVMSKIRRSLDLKISVLAYQVMLNEILRDRQIVLKAKGATA